MRNLLTTLLILFSAGNSLAGVTPEGCFTLEERRKIGQAITDLAKCKVEVAQKDQLIKDNMLQFDKLNQGPAFWQEPSFVFGGMLVGVSVGGLITFLVMSK